MDSTASDSPRVYSVGPVGRNVGHYAVGNFTLAVKKYEVDAAEFLLRVMTLFPSGCDSPAPPFQHADYRKCYFNGS